MDRAVVGVNPWRKRDRERESRRGREEAGADVGTRAVRGRSILVDIDEELVSGTVAAGQLDGDAVSLGDGNAGIWSRGIVPSGDETDQRYSPVCSVGSWDQW